MKFGRIFIAENLQQVAAIEAIRLEIEKNDKDILLLVFTGLYPELQEAAFKQKYLNSLKHGYHRIITLNQIIFPHHPLQNQISDYDRSIFKHALYSLSNVSVVSTIFGCNPAAKYFRLFDKCFDTAKYCSFFDMGPDLHPVGENVSIPAMHSYESHYGSEIINSSFPKLYKNISPTFFQIDPSNWLKAYSNLLNQDAKLLTDPTVGILLSDPKNTFDHHEAKIVKETWKYIEFTHKYFPNTNLVLLSNSPLDLSAVLELKKQYLQTFSKNLRVTDPTAVPEEYFQNSNLKLVVGSFGHALFLAREVFNKPVIVFTKKETQIELRLFEENDRIQNLFQENIYPESSAVTPDIDLAGIGKINISIKEKFLSDPELQKRKNDMQLVAYATNPSAYTIFKDKVDQHLLECDSEFIRKNFGEEYVEINSRKNLSQYWERIPTVDTSIPTILSEFKAGRFLVAEYCCNFFLKGKKTSPQRALILFFVFLHSKKWKEAFSLFELFVKNGKISIGDKTYFLLMLIPTAIKLQYLRIR